VFRSQGFSTLSHLAGAAPPGHGTLLVKMFTGLRTLAFLNAQPSDPEARPGVSWRGVQTRPDGTFVLVGLAASRYTLHVNPMNRGGAGRGARAVQLADVAVGRTDVEVVLEAGLAIEGVLLDPRNQPLAQAYVQARAQQRQEQPSGRGVRFGGGQGAMTDGEGRFRIEGLAPGTYRLTLQRTQDGQRYLLPADEVPAGTLGLRLTAREGERVAGRVEDESGRPLSGAVVTVHVPQSQSVSAASQADGTFVVTGLEPGTCNVTVHAKGYVRQTVADVGTGTTTVRVVMRPGLSVSGKLVDSADKPLASANLSLTHASEQGVQQSARTDTEGRFAADGLVPGEYQVTVMVREGGNRWVNRPCGTLRAGDQGVQLRVAP
jgi:protocatechuate 3,4-dioxygenase beta subunit